MKAAVVRQAISRKFSSNACAVIFEVGDGVGNSTKSGRRADAISVEFWQSRGLEIAGYEIKVDRNDWLRELRMPGKADAHFVRCDRWWLVTPARRPSEPPIVKPEELPGPWGWLNVMENGDIHIAKKAPKLVPSMPFDKNFAFSLIRAADRWTPDEVTASIERVEERLKASFNGRVNLRAAELAKAPLVDEGLMKALREAFGMEIEWLTKPDVIAAIRAMIVARRSAKYIATAQTSKMLRDVADSIDKAAEALKKIQEIDIG